MNMKGLSIAHISNALYEIRVKRSADVGVSPVVLSTIHQQSLSLGRSRHRWWILEKPRPVGTNALIRLEKIFIENPIATPSNDAPTLNYYKRLTTDVRC